MKHTLQRLSTLVLLTFVLVAQGLTLTASTDRNKVGLNESFTLTLQTDGHTSQSLDLAPLRKDFVIIGTSKGSSYSLVNGKASSHVTWQIELAPKHLGLVQIPALHIGNTASNPLSIEAIKASRVATSASPNVYMKAHLSKKTAYVGSQVNYQVKVYYRKQLITPTLSAPVIKGAQMKLLGPGSNYQVRRGNSVYNVSEKDFAIIPDTAGKIVIDAPVLTADIPMQNARGGFFGNSLFTMGNTRPVRVTAAPVTLHVKAIPASISPSNWLPASKLTLQESWSGDVNNWRVGQPLTRTITIIAKGLAASDIPAITLANTNPAYQVYQDKGSEQDVAENGQIEGTKVLKLAIIPSKSGQLTFPAIKVRWFNTETAKQEVATLAAREVTILPAVAAQTTAQKTTNVKQALASQVNNKPASRSTKALMRKGNSVWQQTWFWVAAGLAVLWLMTIVLWRRSKRKDMMVQEPTLRTARSTEKSPNKRHLWQAFKKACESNNAAEVKQTLITYLREKEEGIYSLYNVQEYYQDKELNKLLQALDKALYAEGESTWQAQTLFEKLKVLESKKVKKTAVSREKDTALPPLYPK